MYKLNRIRKRIGSTILCVVAVMLAVGVTPAHASLLTIDKIIYQGGSGVNPGLLFGSLDLTVSGSTLTIVMTNLSLDAAVTNSTIPAQMLLTGFGLLLPGETITGGSATANGTMLNFDPGQTSNLNNQYVYGNSPFDGYTLAGVPNVNGIVSSVGNGGATARFDGGSTTGNPPDGPGYGALSSEESQFGGSTPAVRNSITFVLNLSAAVSFAAIEAGNVVLAFGSPDSVYAPVVIDPHTTVPEPSTYALYGLGISMLFVSGWWQRRKKQALETEY